MSITQRQAAPWQPKSGEMGQLMELIDAICTAAFVNPRIVPNPNYDSGEIAIDDISDRDRFHLLGWALEGADASAATRFLEQSAGSVPPAQNGGGLQQPSE